MSKALKYATQIVSANLANINVPACKEGGENVAAFFEEIYNKISELEMKEDKVTDAAKDAELNNELDFLSKF